MEQEPRKKGGPGFALLAAVTAVCLQLTACLMRDWVRWEAVPASGVLELPGAPRTAAKAAAVGRTVIPVG